MTRAEIVARARACLGARFRAQGRDPASGLDCIGLAAYATGRAASSGYGLRGGGERIAPGLAAAGLEPIMAAEAAPGDLLVVSAGPAQLHLLLLTEAGFIHADAGLRRVVETPGAPRWPLIGAWRAAEEEG